MRECLGLCRPARLAAWIVAAASALVSPAAAAPSLATAAPEAIVVDYETGTVLLAKNADLPVPPASLTKLMTIAVLFDQLRQGRISLETTFPVSVHAWQTGGAASGGSTMFLKVNSQVSVRDLISGLVIQSGNDAAVVVAEGLAGSEEAFAAMMNQQAKAIGLTGSRFANPHGLPHPDERVTMRDMAALAAHLIRTFPDQYASFKEREFTYNKIRQHNRNPVLGLVEGADGLKTGHTAESGYSLVASAERNGRRLILALSGLKSARERQEEAQKLFEWGFRAFETVTVAKAGEVVGEAKVSGGEVPTVALTAAVDVKALVPRGSGPAELTRAVVYPAPLAAPVAKGIQVAMLQIKLGNDVVREQPLVSAAAVAEGTLLQRTWQKTVEFVAGKLQEFWPAEGPRLVGAPPSPDKG